MRPEICQQDLMLPDCFLPSFFANVPAMSQPVCVPGIPDNPTEYTQWSMQPDNQAALIAAIMSICARLRSCCHRIGNETERAERLHQLADFEREYTSNRLHPVFVQGGVFYFFTQGLAQLHSITVLAEQSVPLSPRVNSVLQRLLGELSRDAICVAQHLVEIDVALRALQAQHSLAGALYQARLGLVKALADNLVQKNISDILNCHNGVQGLDVHYSLAIRNAFSRALNIQFFVDAYYQEGQLAVPLNEPLLFELIRQFDQLSESHFSISNVLEHLMLQFSFSDSDIINVERIKRELDRTIGPDSSGHLPLSPQLLLEEDDSDVGYAVRPEARAYIAVSILLRLQEAGVAHGFICNQTSWSTPARLALWLLQNRIFIAGAIVIRWLRGGSPFAELALSERFSVLTQLANAFSITGNEGYLDCIRQCLLELTLAQLKKLLDQSAADQSESLTRLLAMTDQGVECIAAIIQRIQALDRRGAYQAVISVMNSDEVSLDLVTLLVIEKRIFPHFDSNQVILLTELFIRKLQQYFGAPLYIEQYSRYAEEGVKIILQYFSCQLHKRPENRSRYLDSINTLVATLLHHWRNAPESSFWVEVILYNVLTVCYDQDVFNAVVNSIQWDDLASLDQIFTWSELALNCQRLNCFNRLYQLGFSKMRQAMGEDSSLLWRKLLYIITRLLSFSYSVATQEAVNLVFDSLMKYFPNEWGQYLIENYFSSINDSDDGRVVSTLAKAAVHGSYAALCRQLLKQAAQLAMADEDGLPLFADLDEQNAMCVSEQVLQPLAHYLIVPGADSLNPRHELSNNLAFLRDITVNPIGANVIFDQVISALLLLADAASQPRLRADIERSLRCHGLVLDWPQAIDSASAFLARIRELPRPVARNRQGVGFFSNRRARSAGQQIRRTRGVQNPSDSVNVRNNSITKRKPL